MTKLKQNSFLCIYFNSDMFYMWVCKLRFFRALVCVKKSYIGQTNLTLKSRFQEHTRYIKNKDRHLAYALHILKCRHKYGSINDTMTLLKSIDRPSRLLPYEQMYIQLFHHNNHIIPEKYPKEQNPMFQLLYNKYTRHNPLTLNQ
jgi:hypothetical protein